MLAHRHVNYLDIDRTRKGWADSWGSTEFTAKNGRKWGWWGWRAGSACIFIDLHQFQQRQTTVYNRMTCNYVFDRVIVRNSVDERFLFAEVRNKTRAWCFCGCGTASSKTKKKTKRTIPGPLSPPHRSFGQPLRDSRFILYILSLYRYNISLFCLYIAQQIWVFPAFSIKSANNPLPTNKR